MGRDPTGSLARIIGPLSDPPQTETWRHEEVTDVGGA